MVNTRKSLEEGKYLLYAKNTDFKSLESIRDDLLAPFTKKIKDIHQRLSNYKISKFLYDEEYLKTSLCSLINFILVIIRSNYFKLTETYRK